MAAAHKQLVRGLVDRSHERVVQARAGQSLPQILREDEESAGAGRIAGLPQLPSRLSVDAVAPALVYDARANARRGRRADASSEPLPKARRQGVLAASASVGALERGSALGRQASHPHASSHEQFREYVHQKSYRSEGLRPLDRRRGVLPKAADLRKLAAAATAQQREAHESAKTKMARALAKLRGHGAFLQTRWLEPPPTPSFGDIKNAHLAFLEFRRQVAIGTSSSPRRRVHPSVGLENGNTNSRTPIRFGDHICLLSTVSNLPLAVGADGRSHAAVSTAVGPHMTLTVVDFLNPSRRDELTAQDAFWLRVDASALHGDTHSSRASDGDDLEALLVDTSYYLGCPGWLDAECTAHAAQSKRRRRGRADEHPKVFRLVAMKAETPARDYYGDDAATREYAAETNEHVVRLARWRFAVQQPPPQQPQGQRSVFEAPPGDVNDALLNCALVQLSQDHSLELNYDAEQARGVVRPASRRRRASARPAPPESVWQVRLLHRPPPLAGTLPGDGAAPSGVDRDGDEDDPGVQWLRDKQELVARNGEKLQEKARLAQLARQQFERVAAESNSKLAQIEQHKAQRGTAYFEQLLHAASSSPPRVSPARMKAAGDAALREPTRLPALCPH